MRIWWGGVERLPLEVHQFKPAPLGNAGLGQLAYVKGMPILVSAQPDTAADADGISRVAGKLAEKLRGQAALAGMGELAEILRHVKLDHQARATEQDIDQSQKPKLYFPRQGVFWRNTANTWPPGKEIADATL